MVLCGKHAAQAIKVGVEKLLVMREGGIIAIVAISGAFFRSIWRLLWQQK